MSMNTRGGPRNRRKNTPNNRGNTPNKGGVVLKYYYCQKTGHLKKDCYKLKNKDKSYFSREIEESSKESGLEDSLEDLDLEEEEIEEEPLIALEEEEIILFSKENNKNKREWILDSGATSYFSHDKSLFINLKPIKIPVS